MFATVLNWLSGGIIGQIAKPLVRAYEIRKNAENEKDRLIADVAIKDLEADQQARRNAKEIRMATASFPEMRFLTFCTAAPFVLHAAAVGLDTTFSLGWGIPAYPKPFDKWEGRILLSFFGVQATISTVQAIAWAIRGRR